MHYIPLFPEMSLTVIAFSWQNLVTKRKFENKQIKISSGSTSDLWICAVNAVLLICL